jgi:hypothetical protein
VGVHHRRYAGIPDIGCTHARGSIVLFSEDGKTFSLPLEEVDLEKTPIGDGK